MSRYLDLLRQTLTRSLFLSGVALTQRLVGRDWPTDGAETMIGDTRLLNIQMLAQTVIRENIPGDFVECGVWRGGAAIFMAGVLADNQDDPMAPNRQLRRVWVCDSFKGCPAPNPARYPRDEGDAHHMLSFLGVSQTEVKENFMKYGMLRPDVHFIEGFFKDSLPGPIQQISLLRVDGDLYESQMQVLEALYFRISPGGYVIIDDYYNLPGSHHATNDFRRTHGIGNPLVRVDWCAAYWRV